MFKKGLCSLLIVQHFFIYTLQAGVGDFRIIFEEEKYALKSQLTSPVSSLRLKIFKENKKGVDATEIFNHAFDRDSRLPHHFNLSKIKAPNVPNLQVKWGQTADKLHITSTHKDNLFSLYLLPTGDAFLQNMKFSNPLDISTFGKIQMTQKVSGPKLTLTGTSVVNQKKLSLDTLHFTALGSSNSLGKIINSPEGEIIIGKKAHIHQGYFENQGKIFGMDQSTLHLHGNPLSNKYIAQTRRKDFRTKITWQGKFSILDASRFVNEADILSHDLLMDNEGNFRVVSQKNDLKPSKLFILSEYFHNKHSLFSSGSLEVKTAKDFINEGRIRGIDKVSLKIGASLFNKGEIWSKNFLDLFLKGWLWNGEGSVMKGRLVTINTPGLTNYGTISAKNLNLKTKSLQNFFDIIIKKEGTIQEKDKGSGLLNAPGARILSFGNLDISGNHLKNQENRNFQGTIQAKTLVMRLKQLMNEGDIIVEKKGDFHIASITNSVTGALRFNKEGNVSCEKVTNQEDVLGSSFNITTQVFENLGKLTFLKDFVVQVSGFFTNAQGALVSSLKALVLRGQGILKNEGTLQSAEKIEITLPQTANHGRIISGQEVNISHLEKAPHTQIKDFENTGLVLSPKITLKIQNGSNAGSVNQILDLKHMDQLKGLLKPKSLHVEIGDLFTNTGHMVGRSLVELKGTGAFHNEGEISKSDQIISHLDDVDNQGIIRAQSYINFDQLNKKLANSGLILSDGKLDLTSSSRILNSGIIEGRKGDVSLVAEDWTNQGQVSALGGQLTLDIADGLNHHLIFGQTLRLKVRNFFTNESKMRALQAFYGEGVGTFKNLLGGRLLTQEKIQMEGGLHVINEGVLSSLTQIILNQPSYVNAGLIEAVGDILFPNCETFTNTQSGILSSHTGQTQFPKIQLFENEGVFFSQKSVSLNTLVSFINKGLFHTEDKINITADLIDISKVVRGTQGVSLIGEEIKNQAEVSGKNIEIYSTGTPFHEYDGTFIPEETLTLHVPHGWKLDSKPRNFTHSLIVNGPLLEPGHLQIKENFTWNSPSPLSTQFDILVKGLLTLNMGGKWTNLGHVEAQTGARIHVFHFDNKGTFYAFDAGAGETVFDCEEGFDNYGQMEVWGKSNIHARKGWIRNHPEATFHQRNIHQAENQATLTASQGVQNINGTFLFEGDVTINAPITSNITEELGRKPSAYYKGTEDIIPSRKGAIFEAKSLNIKSDTFENIGSKVATYDRFLFKGTTFKNLKRDFIVNYVEIKTSQVQHFKDVPWYEGGGTKGYWVTSKYEVPASAILDSFPALLYSRGTIDYTTPNQTNTGQIEANYINLTANKLDNLTPTNLTFIPKPVPQFTALSSYLDEKNLGAHFWKEDTEKETVFRIIPVKPTPLPASQDIHAQLQKPAPLLCPQGEALKATIQAFQEKVHQTAASYSLKPAKTDEKPTSWSPSPQDLNLLQTTLTPQSLSKSLPELP